MFCTQIYRLQSESQMMYHSSLHDDAAHYVRTHAHSGDSGSRYVDNESSQSSATGAVPGVSDQKELRRRFSGNKISTSAFSTTTNMGTNSSSVVSLSISNSSSSSVNNSNPTDTGIIQIRNPLRTHSQTQNHCSNTAHQAAVAQSPSSVAAASMFVIEGDDDNNGSDDDTDVERQSKAEQHAKNPENNNAHPTMDTAIIPSEGSGTLAIKSRDKEVEGPSVTWRQVFSHKKSVIIGCGLMLFQV